MDMNVHTNNAQLSLLMPVETDVELAPPLAKMRTVIINEDSDELLRIHRKNTPEFSECLLDGYETNLHAQRQRSLLARVVHSAYEDLALAMTKPTPRYNVRMIAGKQSKSENFNFRSAVEFFFGHEAVRDEQGFVVGHYSAFNSYCQLLGLNAPRIRAMFLKRFDGLDRIVSEIIKDKEFMAPVAAQTRSEGGGATLRSLYI